MDYLTLLIPTWKTALQALSLNVRKPLSVQQVSDSLALEDAEDHGAIHGRSGALYLRYLLKSMSFAQHSPTLVYEDNTA
jgi:hypothetical protein